jgi:hypothetical protein
MLAVGPDSFAKSRPPRHKPVHNRDAFFRSPNNTIFEITPALNRQPVLFDFMGAGDVLDLLSSVGARLEQMGRGEPG